MSRSKPDPAPNPIRPQTWLEAQTLLFVDMGLCGCGFFDDAYDRIHQILRTLQDRHTATNAAVDEEARGKTWTEFTRKFDALVGQEQDSALCHLSLSLLDRAGLIEHGSSILGSWITDKGRSLLAFMDLNPEWPDETEVSDHVQAEGGHPEFVDPAHKLCMTARRFVRKMESGNLKADDIARLTANLSAAVNEWEDWSNRKP